MSTREAKAGNNDNLLITDIALPCFSAAEGREAKSGSGGTGLAQREGNIGTGTASILFPA
ncbi:MAG TPA: hypothetical protein VJZ52_02505 [Candidatus Paceibacterota bacterium]|nr:hypothetical protein [Candidatus Paceibacterota bacterium]